MRANDELQTSPRSGPTLLLFATSILAALAWALWTAVDPSRVNHDVAWHHTLAAHLVDGAVFGRDVTDINPPWIFYAHAAAEWMARAVGIAPLVVWNWLCVLMQAGALALCRAPLARAFGRTDWVDVLLSFGMLGLVAGVGYDFGQRDLLSAAVLLPYVCVAAVPSLARKPVHIALVGGLAAFAPLFKAHYGFVILLAELWRLRSVGWRAWITRVDVVAMAVVFVSAAIALGVGGDEWLAALGEDASIYANYSVNFTWLQPSSALVLGAVAIATWSWPAASRPESARTARIVVGLAAAAVSALLLAAVQGKGYPYHLAPAQIFAMATLGVACTGALAAMPSPSLPGRRLLAAGALALLPWWLLVGGDRASAPARFDEIELSRSIGQVLAEVPATEQGVPGGAPGLFAFATSIAPIFPAVVFTEARWMGRDGHLWRFTSLARAAAAEGPMRYPALADLDPVERRWLAGMGQRLAASPPAVIVVDRSPTHLGLARSGVDLLRYFTLEPRIRGVLKGYTTARTLQVTVNGERYDLALLRRK